MQVRKAQEEAAAEVIELQNLELAFLDMKQVLAASRARQRALLNSNAAVGDASSSGGDDGGSGDDNDAYDDGDFFSGDDDDDDDDQMLRDAYELEVERAKVDLLFGLLDNLRNVNVVTLGADDVARLTAVEDALLRADIPDDTPPEVVRLVHAHASLLRKVFEHVWGLRQRMEVCSLFDCRLCGTEKGGGG